MDHLLLRCAALKATAPPWLPGVSLDRVKEVLVRVVRAASWEQLDAHAQPVIVSGLMLIITHPDDASLNEQAAHRRVEEQTQFLTWLEPDERDDEHTGL